MHSKNVLTRSLFTIFTIALILNGAVLAGPTVDDRSDAWVSVSQMIKFIGMGDKSSVERAGNDAICSIEKAVEKEQDSGKKDKLIDAKSQVREAIGYANRGEWPYAEGSAKRALELIEGAK